MDNAKDVRIGFIGIGHLGRSLALALAAGGYKVTGVHSRRVGAAQELARILDGCRVHEEPQKLCDDVDLVFITTPDRAIAPVAESLIWRAGQAAVHCCGATSIELLAKATRGGALAGTFHPCQTFAGVENAGQAVERLHGVAFAVSASGWLLEFLRRLAFDLGGTAMDVPDDQRSLYHSASVLSCGYLVALLKGAVDIWEAMGLSRNEAIGALSVLARTTLDNVAWRGLDASATGPVMRGDLDTIAGHLGALSKSHPDLAAAYAVLGKLSLSIAESKGLDQSSLDSMRGRFEGCLNEHPRAPR